MAMLELKELLEVNYCRFNHPSFIPCDPISIPHQFTRKEDIEISGLLTALISWGNRASILKSAGRLMTLMSDTPFEFIRQASPHDLLHLHGYVHRTFQYEDADFLVRALQHIYLNKGGLEELFSSMNVFGARHAIQQFRIAALEVDHFPRSRKHLADPVTGSAAKRINMFLRWMVRSDNHGVDFGIWKSISPANLICPLDVHSGRVARRLGLLERKANDWKAAEELTASLRKLDPDDPVRYDFALFGMGVSGDKGDVGMR
ncbi:MAG: TIGR02757 family protein [Bacteroidales bacterium]|nr:TIGR02757 family protein [Bacteroidales bacterium]